MACIHDAITKTIKPYGYKVDKVSINHDEVTITIKQFSEIKESELPDGAIKRRCNSDAI